VLYQAELHPEARDYRADPRLGYRFIPHTEA
jgi:hypothetical protein